MDKIEEKYKNNYYVKYRYQRWISNNMQGSLWRINGSDPIPEEFIVIKNEKALEQSYLEAIIGERIYQTPKYNGQALSDIYTDSTRTFHITDLMKKGAPNPYQPKFANMSYKFYEYEDLKGGLPKSIHPMVLTFEDGSKCDVIQYAGKELLLYLFPNVSLIGMYKPEELKEMKLEKVQMIDREYLAYYDKYKKGMK